MPLKPVLRYVCLSFFLLFRFSLSEQIADTCVHSDEQDETWWEEERRVSERQRRHIGLIASGSWLGITVKLSGLWRNLRWLCSCSPHIGSQVSPLTGCITEERGVIKSVDVEETDAGGTNPAPNLSGGIINSAARKVYKGVGAGNSTQQERIRRLGDFTSPHYLAENSFPCASERASECVCRGRRSLRGARFRSVGTACDTLQPFLNESFILKSGALYGLGVYIMRYGLSS